MKDNDKKHKNFINKVSEYSNEYHFLNKYENCDPFDKNKNNAGQSHDHTNAKSQKRE